MILRTQNERALEAEIKQLKIQIQRGIYRDLLESQRIEELLTRLHDVEFRSVPVKKDSVRFTVAMIFITFLGFMLLAVLIC